MSIFASLSSWEIVGRIGYRKNPHRTVNRRAGLGTSFVSSLPRLPSECRKLLGYFHFIILKTELQGKGEKRAIEGKLEQCRQITKLVWTSTGIMMKEDWLKKHKGIQREEMKDRGRR